ncbi:MAG: outer membrane protein assembly factor BamB [Akkermansiaceae bacterium]|jgi:outer membrane protein assembly factor BamB
MKLLLACLPPPVLRQSRPEGTPLGAMAGPLGNGVATQADPPLTWSEDKNVRWKTALPRSGNSFPVVWGDQIFLTATIPHGEEQDPPAGHRPSSHDNTLKVRKSRFVVISLDRKDGQILWQTTVRDQVPHEGHHLTESYASASPITDGQQVFAFFGSHGLYYLNHKGKVLWEKDLGEMHTKHGHGEGSSPALHDETLVVNWDHEGPSFVAAFNKVTGKELWRKERDEPSSWSSPHILLHEGSPQVVVSAANRIRSYHRNQTGRLDQAPRDSPLSSFTRPCDAIALRERRTLERSPTSDDRIHQSSAQAP